MTNQEFSESGSPIFRYDNIKPKEFKHSLGDEKNAALIIDHIEKHIGKIDAVIHEFISDTIHIDINWIKPTEKYPFHTFVTGGMSDLPMNTPEELKEHQFSELCMLLPNEWPINQEYLKHEDDFYGGDNY